MQNSKKIFTEVDVFIDQLHSGDLVISPDAQKLILTQKGNKMSTLGISPKNKKTLPDALGYGIATYQLAKDLFPNSERTIQLAYECLDLIERARTHGFIVYQNVTSKIEKLTQENTPLKEQITSLRKLNVELAKENKELKMYANTIGGSRGSECDE